MAEGPVFKQSPQSYAFAGEALEIQGTASDASVEALARARVEALAQDAAENEDAVQSKIDDVVAARDSLLVAAGESGTVVEAQTDVDEPGDPEAEAATSALLQNFLSRKGITILFDGSLRFAEAAAVPVTAEEVRAALALPELTMLSIIEDVLLDCEARSIPIKASMLKVALSQLVRRERRLRKVEVLAPLCAPPTEEEIRKAETEWSKLAVLFTTDPALVKAVLQQFIWLVKLRSTQREKFIEFHLMPIIRGDQSGGKTTFVRKFIEPLEELAIEYRLADLVDSRVREVFRYAIVYADDVGRIPAEKVTDLKMLITAERVTGRILQTSDTTSVPQRATFIGSSNAPIRDLVPDPTGHRRFIDLEFRSGDVARGGDPAVWEVVNSLDYRLLWRSVDLRGPSPILPFRELLVEAQALKPMDHLERWLRQLDLESSAVREVTTRDGVRAQELHALFLAQTDLKMSASAFGTKMRLLAADQTLPFGKPVHTKTGNFYPVRRKSRPLPERPGPQEA